MNRILEESIVLISSASEEKPEKDNIGTGFPFYKDREKNYTYLLTCAHVVEDVGGKENVLVNSIPAEVLAIGEIDGFDLAVLGVERLNIPLLQLINLSEAESRKFKIAGNYLFSQERKKRLQTVEGIFGQKSFLTQNNQKVIAWDLLINSGERLQNGYSGAPVVDQKTGFVLGITTNMEQNGARGLAISTEALSKIWPQIPSAISLELILNNILFTLPENYWEIIKKAYLNCCPEDWPYTQPENIKEIIDYLLEIPQGSNSYSSLIEFVAHLLIEPKNKGNSNSYDKLKTWGEKNYDDLDRLLDKLEKTKSEHKQKKSDFVSCLMVYIKPSLQNDNQQYLVSAWFIPDLNEYNYQSAEKCYKLDTEKENFSLAEIKELLKDLWDESDQYVPEINSEQTTIVEFFLPRELFLTEEIGVESWEIEDVEDLEPVGIQNQVIIRSSKRLEYRKKRYQHKWKTNWQNLSEICNDACSPHLKDEFDEKSLILKLTQTPSLEDFKQIDQAAIPIIIWLRKAIEDEDVECINNIFQVNVQDLPEQVRQQRKIAFKQQQPELMGKHISLFWEHPYRIPPNINYLMA